MDKRKIKKKERDIEYMHISYTLEELLTLWVIESLQKKNYHDAHHWLTEILHLKK